MSRADSIFDTKRTMKFHLELTDKCNAACPMCGRTKQMDRCLPDMTKVRNIELELDLIKRNFTLNFAQRSARSIYAGVWETLQRHGSVWKSVNTLLVLVSKLFSLQTAACAAKPGGNG